MSRALRNLHKVWRVQERWKGELQRGGVGRVSCKTTRCRSQALLTGCRHKQAGRCT